MAYNADLLGPDHPWIERTHTFSVVDGAAETDDRSGSPTNAAAMLDVDLMSSNMEMTTTIESLAHGAGTYASVAGPAVRMSELTRTWYTALIVIDNTTPTGRLLIEKEVDDVETPLGLQPVFGTDLPALTFPLDLTLRVVDTAITVLINGTSVATRTDSSIVSGTKAGIVEYAYGASDHPRISKTCVTPLTATGPGPGGGGGGSTGNAWDGTTQPILAWAGTIDVDHLLGDNFGGNRSGVYASASVGSPALDQFQIAGVNWMVGSINGIDPTLGGNIGFAPQLRAQCDVVCIGGQMAPIPYTSDGPTAFSNKIAYWQVLCDIARTQNFDWVLLDGEPYSQPTNSWSQMTQDEAYSLGVGFGNAVAGSTGKMIIYPSSNASFPGSYNDLIQIQDGNGSLYGPPHAFPRFLDGLVSTGIDICLQDATFHFGVQYAPDAGDWHSGIQRSVLLTETAYPGIRGSCQEWPDNDERNGASSSNPSPGFFAPAQFEGMMLAALQTCHGPIMLYNHYLSTESAVYDVSAVWNDSPGWLQAVNAAVSAAGP